MLHYFARNFFAPVIVRGHQKETGELDVYVISDEVRSISNVKMAVNVYSWNSQMALHSYIINDIFVSILVNKFVATSYVSVFCAIWFGNWNTSMYYLNSNIIS